MKAITKTTQIPKKVRKMSSFLSNSDFMSELFFQNKDEDTSTGTRKRRKYFQALNSGVEYTPEKIPKYLNTDTVATGVEKVLSENGITKKKLAEEYLDVKPKILSGFLVWPTPWTECSEFRKGLYTCLRDWSSSTDKINSLKSPSIKKE